MRTPDLYLHSLGVHLPPRVSVASAVEQGQYPAEDAEYFQLAGVPVAGGVPAPELALRAARQAFERAGRTPSELDLLLYADVWQQGPEGWQPQYYLQQHLTGGDLLAVEVRHGCCGMFSALELAASYLRAEPDRRAALLVAADNFSTPLVDRWRMIPGCIMGDAGCALLVGTEPGFARPLAVNRITVPAAEAVNHGVVPLFPPDLTVGRRLDFGARTRDFRDWLLERDGTGVFITVQQALLELIEQTLDESDTKLHDVKRVAFQHGRRDDLELRELSWLGMTLADSTWDFARTVGHCGASDQFLALDHLLATGQLEPGDRLLVVGLGAGLAMACTVIEILAVPPWYRTGPARPDHPKISQESRDR